MRSTARVLVVALAILTLLGFAAEPTTSTQFDVVEGRGVVVTQSAHQLHANNYVADDRPEPEPLVVALLVLLAVGLSAAVLARQAHEAGGRLPSLLGRATLAHRGPPALV